MRSAQERQKSANAPTVKQSINPNVYGMPGKVLQIDGDKEYLKMGIGTQLMKTAHELCGGEKDIVVYLTANENAIPFYEKIGMKKAEDVMQYNKIDWTYFKVE